MTPTTSRRSQRMNLTRHVAELFAREPGFREMITAVDEDGERLIICVLPNDTAGYLFDQLEARGRPGNVVMPTRDGRLRITYWTCTPGTPIGELVECSDEATVEMVLQCADAAAANGAEVSFQRHAGMHLAGGREYALVA